MKLLFSLVCIFSLTLPTHGQAAKAVPGRDELELRRIALISELQALEARAGQLEAPLALAAAKAEIADAAWTLDAAWAKRLLREAYELTYPSEKVRDTLRQLPIGSTIITQSPVSRSRHAVRRRVMSVAGRDRDFADELVRAGAQELGRLEEHLRYSELADSAAARGETEDASRFVRRAFEAEPTEFPMAEAIFALARQDRAAADKLILEYIERLKPVPLSLRDGGRARVLLILGMLVSHPPTQQAAVARQVPPPGPAVWRAYLDYMLDLMAQDERREPGSLQRSRSLFLALWPQVSRHAPALTERFKELEALSRGPGDGAAWPPRNESGAPAERHRERLKEVTESGDPEAGTISLLIDRGEFAGARKLLDKLAGGPQKTDLCDKLHAKEAGDLVRRGDLVNAQTLAGRLTKAAYIIKAYPPIIEKCLAAQDRPCAVRAARQAARQLRAADVAPPALPPGVPASAIEGARESDPTLAGLCRLAQLMLPADATLAFEVLDELVASADASAVDTGLGRVGFEVEVFRRLAGADGPRVRRAALSFKDPLRQVVSLAAVYKWEAEQLRREAEAPRPAPAREARPAGRAGTASPGN